MSNITIKDIANEYAKSVNYHPNPIALSLRENKSYSIGVIVPEIANNYFSEVINGIDSVASQHGYHVVIYQTHESYEREISTIQHVLSRKADGLIISLSVETNDFAHLHSAMEDNFPIIFFDRVPPIENCFKVVSDNYQGAYNATSHLITQGKRRIAHITSPPVLSITRERLAGYKAALNDNNIEVDEQLIRYCGFEPKDAFETIDELIKNQKPDSIFVCSDRLALNCLEAIKNNTGEESKNLGLIGYTNLKTANLLYTPLSTIRQPAFEMGVRAAELLIKILESKNRKVEFQTITLKNELLIR
jgi:LacI family transcriptional regulator